MRFDITILGSSAALPTRDRQTSSQLLEVGNSVFLIDCGEGTQFALRRIGFNVNQIQRILISHLHGDHYFGLLPLILSMHLLSRHSALYIHADRRLEPLIQDVFAVAETQVSFPVHFQALGFEAEEVIYENGNLMVSSFPLKHRIPTCGFSVKTVKERVVKYSYCSDTMFDDSYLPSIANSDLLYHEATFAKDRTAYAHQKRHSTAAEAAKAALLSGSSKLLIGHFSARYFDPEILEEEAKAIFPDTVLASDGLRLSI